jgi:alpha-1,3-glucosyltransferase
MSQVAPYIDPGLLNVKDLGYNSWQTVYFQRTTVILTELVLVYALHLYLHTALHDPPSTKCSPVT